MPSRIFCARSEEPFCPWLVPAPKFISRQNLLPGKLWWEPTSSSHGSVSSFQWRSHWPLPATACWAARTRIRFSHPTGAKTQFLQSPSAPITLPLLSKLWIVFRAALFSSAHRQTRTITRSKTLFAQINSRVAVWSRTLSPLQSSCIFA